MVEQTILGNKFFREFCFSNYFIAAYWLKADSFDEVESYLNNSRIYLDANYEYLEDLLVHKQSKTEIKALEHVVSNLMSDLKSCKFDLEIFNP